MDISWSCIVDEGANEPRLRQAMRGWIKTGQVELPDDDEEETATEEQPQRRRGFEPREINNPVTAARSEDGRAPPAAPKPQPPRPRTAADRPTIKIAEGVKVSKHDMDVFKEMGGTMKRSVSRIDPLFAEKPDEVL